MKKQLITVAITAALLATTAPGAFASEDITPSGKKNRYIGAGIGAVAGALLAGPVGLITGGVIGGLARTDATAESSDGAERLVIDEPRLNTDTETTDDKVAQSETEQLIALAQQGEIAAVIDRNDVEAASDIEEHLITDINFDVFFLSGSTSLEAFYKPQIQSIAGLLHELPDLDVHLEGYSDRRGDEVNNLALANQRLEAVRNELEQAGIDADRIHLTAYGEQRFVSEAGNLEAYTFDRRVVIRFEHTADRSESPVANADNTAEI